MSATATKPIAGAGNGFPRTIPLLCKAIGMDLECLELQKGALYRISVFFNGRVVSALLTIPSRPDSHIGIVRAWMYYHAETGMAEDLLGPLLYTHIKTMV